MNTKQILRTFTEDVNRLLWTEWDPIGCGVPEDEYLSYATVVAGMAFNNKSIEDILRYLYISETQNIGLPILREEAHQRNLPIVQKLIKMADEIRKAN